MGPDLQRIDVKLLLDVPSKPDLDQFLVIFDRWRKDEDHPADWVDLADYAHLTSGPGILIAGKRDTFSVNLNPPGPGLLTSVRSGLAGSLEDRFREALRRATEFNAAVMAEPEFPVEFAVREGAWEIYLNDRLGYPNTDQMDRIVRPAVASALGIAPESLMREPDSRNRLGYSAR
ncbi:MAG: hypothetical protein OXB91_11610 [Bryobacterales bacterium]|nr:hypothetical protein [Bryobacterales bacterium]